MIFETLKKIFMLDRFLFDLGNRAYKMSVTSRLTHL